KDELNPTKSDAFWSSFKSIRVIGRDAERDFQEFQESVESVHRTWLTLGRLETAWSIKPHDNQYAVVVGWYALGVHLIEEPLATLAQKYARVDPRAAANIPIADGITAHQLTEKYLLGLTKDILYVVCDGDKPALFKAALARKSDEGSSAEL